MEYRVRRAEKGDEKIILEMLNEAAQWMASFGRAIWPLNEFDSDYFNNKYQLQDFFVGFADEEPFGLMALITHDPIYWSAVPPMDSVFIHKLTVKRKFAGQNLSRYLLAYAEDHAKKINVRRLRLDVHSDREKVRKIYENFGFKLFDETLILKDYHVAYYIKELD